MAQRSGTIYGFSHMKQGSGGWAGFNDAHIAADDFFKELQSRGIRFYDDARQLAPLFRLEIEPQGPRTPDGRPLVDADFFNEKDAEDYLIFEDEEGEYGQPFIVRDNEDDDEDELDDLPF